MKTVQNEEIEVAYSLLKTAGKTMYYKDLILAVLDKVQSQSVQSQSLAISEIYTMINMDSRFQHMGKGMWGLTEWIPQDTKRSSAAAASEKSSSSRREKLLEEIQDQNDVTSAE